MLPDYVLSEAEDRARRRYCTPSNISPWSDGVSMMLGLSAKQCAELRRLGIDPATVDWMWVTVPITEPFDGFDRYAYGRPVQHLACPIIRTVGQRVQVLTPRGLKRNTYAGGQLSPPRERKERGGFFGR
jgi:hypothetical protein